MLSVVEQRLNYIWRKFERKHLLGIYSSAQERKLLNTSFLESITPEQTPICVTCTPELALDKSKIRLISFITPEVLPKLELVGNLRILVDASSIDSVEKQYFVEQFLEEIEASILCSYDLYKLDNQLLDRLISIHDFSFWILLRPEYLEPEWAKLIKQNLDLIVLWMLVKQPGCGKELSERIHAEFGVLPSPSQIYPTLKILEGRGLIQSQRSFDRKLVYKVTDKSKVLQLISKILEFRQEFKQMLISKGILIQ